MAFWFQISGLLVLASVVLAILKLIGYTGIKDWSWWIIAIPAAVPLAPVVVVIIFVVYALKKRDNNQAQ